MTLKQLEYLLKVVECGSITKATKALYVSQPSLTKSIVGLEEEYGLSLLVRKPRGVELTPDGKAFVYYAKGVLAAANALRQNLKSTDPQGIPRSRLFLAAQQLGFVHELFFQTYLQNQNARIHYNLVETERNDVVQKVLSGDVDLGLLVRCAGDAKTFLLNAEAKRLSINPIAQAGVWAAVGPSSPLYHRKEIRFREAEACAQIALDVESQAAQNLYFDTSTIFFNKDKIVFVNSIAACEAFLLRSDMLLFVSAWTKDCFQNPKIHTIPMRDSSVPSFGEEANELVWIKRANDPLNFTELQFLQMVYHHFGKEDPFVNDI